jgi:hypothetical protein
MAVLLHHSGDMPEASAYGIWFAVTGVQASNPGRRPQGRKLPNLADRLEGSFNAICSDWWTVAQALADGPGAELAYATTAAGYGSDFGLMMAWGQLTQELAREKDICLVVCDDPWLFRHLTLISGVRAGKVPALWPAVIKSRFRGMLAQIHLVARLAWAAVVTRHQRTVFKVGDSVILVYGHPRSTAEGHDEYFGSMMKELQGLKRLLHTDCGPVRARALAADGRTASLHAWGNPLWTAGLLFKGWQPQLEHRLGPFGWLVRRAAEMEKSGGAHAMNAWQRRCQEAWLAQVSPAVVAWPWENHGWERAFCRDARRLGVATLGYQHTVIGPHQLNYSPATNVDGEESLPDTILCNGPAYRDQLLDWGIPADRLGIGGSLRIQRIEGIAHDTKAPVFVALSAKRGIARQQMRAIEAATEEKGVDFLVKEHPMYPMNFRESNRIRRTRDALEAQPSLSAVFFSTGTLGLEALLAGLPVFRLLPEDDIAIDIMPAMASAVPVTGDELAKALSRVSRPPALSWEDVLSPVDWPLWRKWLSPGAVGRTAAEDGPEALPKPKEKNA